MLGRRELIRGMILSSAVLASSCLTKKTRSSLSLLNSNQPSKSMSKNTAPFELPSLPYPRNALAPHISENTINYHYGKHHQAYVTNLNNLISGTDLESKTLEEIIKATAHDKARAGIFNNAAQVWNHTFYWHSMKPKGGGTPSGKLLKMIEADFGSFDNFYSEFKNAGVTQFGSGWAWLTFDGKKLKVSKTGNAETPISANDIPLLTMDVWEHAYYLDYQNARPNYVDVFLKNLVNWDFAAANLAKL